MVDEGAPACVSDLVVELEFLARIKVAQLEDLEYTKINQLLRHKGFALRMRGCSPISNKCVSEDEGLRKEIMSKAHYSLYTIHPRSTKMYKDEKMMELVFSTDFHP